MDKQHLREYACILNEIRDLERQREAAITELFSKKSKKGEEDMPRGKGSTTDPVIAAVERREKFERQIDEKIDRLIDIKREIEEAVEDLPSRDRRLIRLRYIEELSWRRVVEELFGDRDDFLDRYDSYKRRVLRWHQKIIKKICKCP